MGRREREAGVARENDALSYMLGTIRVCIHLYLVEQFGQYAAKAPKVHGLAVTLLE